MTIDGRVRSVAVWGVGGGCPQAAGYEYVQLKKDLLQVTPGDQLPQPTLGGVWYLEPAYCYVTHQTHMCSGTSRCLILV